MSFELFISSVFSVVPDLGLKETVCHVPNALPMTVTAVIHTELLAQRYISPRSELLDIKRQWFRIQPLNAITNQKLANHLYSSDARSSPQ